LLASACTTPGAILPPADDLKAVTEAKPLPTDDIATSQKAADDFSASIEAWGDRISAAGARICRYVERSHGKLPFRCPKAKEGEQP
jgi:hypothetical protein